MSEREPRLPLEFLRAASRELERRGYYWLAVEKEHTEAIQTDPLEQRLRGQIRRRGFGKVAGRTILTFSGYEGDTREIYEIAEIRQYFSQLDRRIPALPALLAFLPEMAFNGPGLYLMLLGEIGGTIHRPGVGGYDVEVRGAERIVQQALQRIRAAASIYRLPHNQRIQLEQRFLAGSRFRLQ